MRIVLRDSSPTHVRRPRGFMAAWSDIGPIIVDCALWRWGLEELLRKRFNVSYLLLRSHLNVTTFDCARFQYGYDVRLSKLEASDFRERFSATEALRARGRCTT